jgi:hypothetical protein
LGAVCRLVYTDDVAAGQLAVFQGGPTRIGGKVPISELIRFERATRKNSQLAAAQRVTLKMGRQLPAHFQRNDITVIRETMH